MLFNSTAFVVFFLVVYAGYLWLDHYKRQNVLLLIASYVFYAWWDVRFLPLLILPALVDFSVGRALAARSDPGARKLLVAISVLVNLSLLGFFKYYNFAVESAARLLEWIGLQPNLTSLNIILPVGISFYTFQRVSYVIDVYRGKARATDSLLEFALYAACFPQLLAGPIEHASAFLPQLQRRRTITGDDIRVGLVWVVLGYFKKVALADTVAPLVDRAFDDPSAVTGITSCLAVLGYTVQIYGDFAGYTLIARGVARLMGLHLTENFRLPYLATDPRDFWRRWHISLSTWLRDYLYFPLGGNRKGPARTYFNLMATMLLGGLWHGASWTFVLWGAYHGVLLCVCHLLGVGKDGGGAAVPFKSVRVALTFMLTMFGWLIFRVPSMHRLHEILLNVVCNWRWDSGTTAYARPILAMFCLLMAYHIWQERSGDMLALAKTNRWFCLGVCSFALLVTLAVGFRPVPFVYFQF